LLDFPVAALGFQKENTAWDFEHELNTTYEIPTATMANHHRAGGLKQYKFILS
jgi:hypothetical protein